MAEASSVGRARALGRAAVVVLAASAAALATCSKGTSMGAAGGDAATGQPAGAGGASGQGGGASAAAGDGGAADAGDGGAVDGGVACVGTCGADGGSDFTAACAALLPCFGAASEVRFDTGTHGFCYGATSSPGGQIDLGLFDALPSFGNSFRLHAPDGTALGGVLDLLFASGPDIDPWFHWTAGGYQGIVHDPANTPPPLRFRTWDGNGAVIGDTAGLQPVASAPDGQGGSVLVADLTGGGGTVLARVDAGGAVTAETMLDDRPELLLVNWGSGHVLLVKAGVSARARWYDVGSGPLTPWFDVSLQLDATQASLHGLLDGSIALSDGAMWRNVFWDAVDHPDQPPAWLLARPGTRIANLPDGRGYAVLPKPFGAVSGGFQIQSLVEVLDSSGNGCGALELPPLPAPPAGATRSADRLDVGQDGTLFEMSALSGPTEVLGMGGHCVFRFWPGLFR